MKIVFEFIDSAQKTLMLFWNRMKLSAYGIKYGKNFRAFGKVTINIKGRSKNITIGDNVTFLGNIVLYNRENGTIEIQDRVTLDHESYLCAANDGMLVFEKNVRTCYYFTVNAGASVHIGASTLIAAFVNINASDHNIRLNERIMEQGYTHSPVKIGSDVWVGNHVSINRGVEIADGAIIGSNSVVAVNIPENAIALGIPARVVKYRE